MKFTNAASSLILLAVGASADTANASTAVDGEQQQQLHQDDPTSSSLRRGTRGHQLRANSEAAPGIDERNLKSLFVSKKEAGPTASSDSCKSYAPSSDEQKLCKQLRAYFAGEGDSMGVKQNICDIIEKIYDPIVIVKVIETSGVYGQIMRIGEF